MVGLITLNCPTCGGKLEVGKDTFVLICKHCGSEHLVQHAAGAVTLEYFARCPCCRRNDRVEKVSAILRKYQQDLSTRETRVITYVDKNGQESTRTMHLPAQKSPVHGLAHMLQVKHTRIKQPTYRSTDKQTRQMDWAVGISAVFVISLFVALVYRNIPFILTFFILTGGGVYEFFSGKERKESIEKYNARLAKAYSKAKEDWQNKYTVIHERHQKLYYCHRDDCVFIPGEGTYAPVEQMQAYLYRESQT